MKKILGIFIMAVCMIFASCTSCKHETPVAQGYDYDAVVVDDYDYIASQYDDFKFYEADVEFDTTIDCKDAYVKTIVTVFQCGDTCVRFYHNADYTCDTTAEYGHWMECSPMNARNAVSFDSCMTIIDTLRPDYPTRYMTFRRLLAPPFPENGQYIFGRGLLIIDAATGEIVDWGTNGYIESGLKQEADTTVVE